MVVDINADMGESAEQWATGTDPDLLRVVTSANVCTGAYAGTAELISDTCREGHQQGVVIGAQVGYPDRVNFGRQFLDMAPRALYDQITTQIHSLQRHAADVGATVRYVKPHGALYHAIAHHDGQARAVIAALEATGGLPLVGPPTSLALDLARSAGIDVVIEGFADRRYLADGTLAPRTESDALLTDPAAVAQQSLRLWREGVRTICVHSDTPNAIQIARAVRTALEDAGAKIGPFAL